MSTCRVDGRCCGVVRSKSAGTEPLGTGLKQLTEDGEAGIGRQRALSPGLMMMMMMMMFQWLGIRTRGPEFDSQVVPLFH